MKKTYISPATETIVLAAGESIMLTMSTDTTVGGSEALSNKQQGGWNCADWTGNGEEE